MAAADGGGTDHLGYFTGRNAARRIHRTGKIRSCPELDCGSNGHEFDILVSLARAAVGLPHGRGESRLALVPGNRRLGYAHLARDCGAGKVWKTPAFRGKAATDRDGPAVSDGAAVRGRRLEPRFLAGLG